jgi:hypothetical protein
MYFLTDTFILGILILYGYFLYKLAGDIDQLKGGK